MLAPICLFTYNRLVETRETIRKLKENKLAKESDLFIFSDGPKENHNNTDVLLVRNYLKTINGFKSIHIFESNKNKGLAKSIIIGVTQIIEEYGKVIVLEDDLITSPCFLSFMNNALDYYKDKNIIQSINGFSLPLKNINNDVYFQTRPFPWGWGTWKDRWDQNIFDKNQIKKEVKNNPVILKNFKHECGNDIDKMLMDSINNINNSWYVRWTYDHFKNKKISLYPSYSLVENIGYNNNGTHCSNVNSYKTNLLDNDNYHFNFINPEMPSKNLKNEFLFYFSSLHKIMIRIPLLFTNVGRKVIILEIQKRYLNKLLVKS